MNANEKERLEDEKNRQRHARQAAGLRELIANGTLKSGARDNHGNSIETLINALERSVKS